mmetsp:Transcript_10200/g.37775  ORF Transcript_10200/g.37775 Transcript_10200/m.37775 type:complete len:366 (+) Transcript_10200:458-1555(+)
MIFRNDSSSACSSKRIVCLIASWFSFAATIDALAAAAAARFISRANSNFSSCSSKYKRSNKSSISSRARSFRSFSFVKRSKIRSASSRFAAPIWDAASSRLPISSANRTIAASSSRSLLFSPSRASSRRDRNFLTQVCVSRTFCALRINSASSSSRIFCATKSTASLSARNSALASRCATFFSSIWCSKSTRAAPRDSRANAAALSSWKTALTRCRSASACVAASTEASRSAIIAFSSLCNRRSKLTSAARSFSLSSRNSLDDSATCWWCSSRRCASRFFKSNASTIASSSAAMRCFSVDSREARSICSIVRSSAARSRFSRSRRMESLRSNECTTLPRNTPWSTRCCKPVRRSSAFRCFSMRLF